MQRRRRSFGYIIWETPVLHLFVDGRQDDGGRRRNVHVELVWSNAGINNIQTLFVDKMQREESSGATVTTSISLKFSTRTSREPSHTGIHA